MKESITIKSAKDGSTLTFSELSGESFAAELTSPSFSGRVVASTYHSGAPSLLFESIAPDWCGWSGFKEWAALGDDLRLRATSDLTGHVSLSVIMRVYDGEEWRLQGWLTLEAGQLGMLSGSVRRFFAHDAA